MKPKFRVYGGGFTGLATAACLLWHGVDVELFEPASTGGILQTTTSDFGGFYESAAMGVVRTKLTQRLFEFAEVNEVKPSSLVSKKFIFNSKPKRLPVGLSDATLAVVGAIGLMAKTSGSKPKPGETLRDWGGRVLGQGACQKVLEPGFQGVYGGNSKELSAKLVTRKLLQGRDFKPLKQFGTITAYPEGGMGQLMSALRQKLKSKGVMFHESTDLEGPDSLNGQVAICVGLKAFLNLSMSGTRFEEFSEKLASVPALDLASAYIVAKRPNSEFEGYGCLFPEEAGFSALGVQFDPGLFRTSKDNVHFHRFIYGWQKGFDLRDKAADKVKEASVRDFHKLYGEAAEQIDGHVSVWRSALPFYGLKFEKCLESYPKPGTGLNVFGNFTGTVGLSDILERSYNWAKQVA